MLKKLLNTFCDRLCSREPQDIHAFPTSAVREHEFVRNALDELSQARRTIIYLREERDELEKKLREKHTSRQSPVVNSHRGKDASAESATVVLQPSVPSLFPTAFSVYITGITREELWEIYGNVLGFISNNVEFKVQEVPNVTLTLRTTTRGAAIQFVERLSNYLGCGYTELMYGEKNELA